MLAQIITENGVKKIQPLTADVGAGAPVGSLAMMYKKSAPSGYLYCDGSTFNAATYPALYAYLGSNTLPDYREFAPVGAEQNTTDTIAAHDVYAQGEGKDDQVQDHSHDIYVNGTKFGQAPNSNAATGNQLRTINNTGSGNDVKAKNIDSGRSGTVTRGKRKAVYFYIKATSGLAENQQENVLATINENNSYSTTEQPTGAKWIDGKPIYRKVIEGSITAVDMDINHNIANIDSIVNVIPYMVSNDGNTVNTPFNISTTYYFTSYATKTQLKVMAGSTYINANKYRMILEYTKTTD